MKPILIFWRGRQRLKQSAEKSLQPQKGDPQALKSGLIFCDLAARVELVPFPKPARAGKVRCAPKTTTGAEARIDSMCVARPSKGPLFHIGANKCPGLG